MTKHGTLSVCRSAGDLNGARGGVRTAVYGGQALPAVVVCDGLDSQQALAANPARQRIDVPTQAHARISFLKKWAREQRKRALAGGAWSVLILPVFAAAASAQSDGMSTLSGIEGVVDATIQPDGSLLVSLDDGSSILLSEGQYTVTADGQILVEAEAVANAGAAVAGPGALAGLGGLVAAAAAAGGGGGGGGGSSPSTSGFVIDGPIGGATVFRDENGNGQRDDGEAFTTTDTNGAFTLGGDPNAPIVSTGGVDVTTGLEFQGTLTAPAGSTVVSPVTTLVQALVDRGQSVEEAVSSINTALGLTEGTDLLNEEPISAGNNELFAAGAKVANILSVGISAGADGGAVIDALAGVLDGSSGGDPLADNSVVQNVLQQSLDNENSTPVGGNNNVGAIAETIANANGVIADRAESADPGDIDGIADVQKVVQGQVADEVERGEATEAVESNDIEDQADNTPDVVDGRVQFNGAFSEDFNGEILVGGPEVNGAWETDRFAPEAFEIIEFEGESVLRMTTASVEQDVFRQTQGRKLDLPVEATEASIKLYIDPDWDPGESGTGFRQAGFWAQATNASDGGTEEPGTAFPLIEFSTLEGEPNFRVYTGVGSGQEAEWIDLGVPDDFAYGSFQELSIAINDDGSVTFTVGDLSQTVGTENGNFNVATIDKVILQGHNSVPGDETAARPSYDIIWDDLEVVSEDGVVDRNTDLSIFENVEFTASSYQVVDGVNLTLTLAQADGLSVTGAGTVRLVGAFDPEADLSGITAAIDATAIEGFTLSLSADQADGAQIDLADDATLTIDVEYAELSAENPSLTPEIDISGITVDGSSSPTALFEVLDAGSVADTFKLLWNAADNAYYDAFPGTPEVNGANIELGNLYAQYLLDGGEPLLDIVQTKVGGAPDFDARQQSLHDNLLGNLTDAAVDSRLNSDPPQLNGDNRDAAGLNFADRPIYDGNEGSEDALLASQIWDVANGIPRDDLTIEDGQIFVLNGNTLVDADDDPENGITPFTDLLKAGEAAGEGAYIVLGDGTYAGDFLITSSVSVVAIGDAIISGSIRVDGEDDETIVTISGVDIEVTGETHNYGFYLRGEGVELNLDDVDVSAAEGAAGALRGIETEIGSDPVIKVSGGSFTGLTSGIYLNPEAKLTVDGATFSGNTAGIGTDDPASVTVTNTTFDGNAEAIGFSGNVDNSNVTLSGNSYEQESDQVLVYFVLEDEPVAIPGEWDNVTIVQSNEDAVDGTNGDDVIVASVSETGQTIYLEGEGPGEENGGSDFILLTASESFVPASIRDFTTGDGQGADVLAFRVGGDAEPLRGSAVETLSEGDALGGETGFVIFTTQLDFSGTDTEDREAILNAVDGLAGGDSGTIIVALSVQPDPEDQGAPESEATKLVSVNLDDTLEDADRIVDLAMLDNTVNTDLSASNLYDFSAVAANT